MIIHRVTKVDDGFITIESFEVWFYITGHRIKSYSLIKCDKLYLLTNVNDISAIVIFHVIDSS
jgi:hypothetical protein